MQKLDKYTVLKQYFGYDTFRDKQELLIDSILMGQDCLGVMPTGAGKSICFQVPAMLLSGITLVVSPLISLMKDQVNTLKQSGIRGAFLNSSLTQKQYSMALANAQRGDYKIIYVAPERLLSSEFLAFAKQANISMLTIDEAHCISQWGQDFRPSYKRIVEFVQELPRRPVLSAFTATATKEVREDIVSSLSLINPQVFISGFDRANLYFDVQKPKDKFAALVAFLRGKKEQTGMVYCATRKTVEEVCDKLNAIGFSATRYHAGLSDLERMQNQEDFIFDKVPIIVATNAFGMGIDKSNASFVVHYNMPKNMESYYQEAGRAGRDGSPSECLLLYGGQDVRTQMFLIDNNQETKNEDEEALEWVKTRDRKRLKEMTFYCHTTECLRTYILKYFGEKSGNFCGNCSNCNHHFETVDITQDAQKILSCVFRAQQRYGIKTIIDILQGSKNEKIMRLNLHKLSTYNIMETTQTRIRDMISHLVLEEYLLLTNDEFPVLQLGARAHEVLKEKKTIYMKLNKEEKIPEAKKTNELSLANPELFAQLKQLRMRIASQQGVPAFVVFSDSTLLDMCIKLPQNKEQLLNVSGVGHMKSSRYGNAFLQEIASFINFSNEKIKL